MKVHYISPYSREKDIGRAINAVIRQLNADDDDWIVHTDHDVLWLLPDSKLQLEDTLECTGYDILGPITNRLGSNTQLVAGTFDETDILEHIHIAKSYADVNYGKEVPTNETLAAFCLCFRVSTWKALGGFQEKSLQFDWYFSEMAKKMGFKLAIMIGIYCFHIYRIDKNKNDYTHLI